MPFKRICYCQTSFRHPKKSIHVNTRTNQPVDTQKGHSVDLLHSCITFHCALSDSTHRTILFSSNSNKHRLWFHNMMSSKPINPTVIIYLFPRPENYICKCKTNKKSSFNVLNIERSDTSLSISDSSALWT